MSMPFDLINSKFMILLLVNGIFLLILLRGIYYRFTPNRDAIFGFFLFGSGVFLVTNLLHDVDISMGFAFGLFAVFSMLRYRTESIPIRDMTYLFLVIVISLLTAITPVNSVELVILNSILCFITFWAESKWFAPRVHEKNVLYEKIENIKPERRDDLISDLNLRTGLMINTVEVVSIDFLRDVAELRVYYQESNQRCEKSRFSLSHLVARCDTKD